MWRAREENSIRAEIRKYIDKCDAVVVPVECDQSKIMYSLRYEKDSYFISVTSPVELSRGGTLEDCMCCQTSKTIYRTLCPFGHPLCVTCYETCSRYMENLTYMYESICRVGRFPFLKYRDHEVIKEIICDEMESREKFMTKCFVCSMPNGHIPVCMDHQDKAILDVFSYVERLSNTVKLRDVKPIIIDLLSCVL